MRSTIDSCNGLLRLILEIDDRFLRLILEIDDPFYSQFLQRVTPIEPYDELLRSSRDRAKIDA